MLFKRLRGKKNQKPAAAKKGRTRTGPTIITGDVAVEGHVFSGGELQIDGEITGNVRARGVVIDYNGLVRGQVTAEDVIIRGRIIGPICGLNVHLLSGAHVEGDIFNKSISIENGAYIDGAIHRVEDPLGEETQPALADPAHVDPAHVDPAPAQKPETDTVKDIWSGSKKK